MHWTYSQREKGSDLQQGDFLAPTIELKEILEEIHPHFCADKYIGFVVTTQTCDLVKRGGKPPKAQYINIAVVRSLKETSTRFFEEILKPVEKGIFRKSDKGDAKEFLHRLFNQNEQALGLFYFHNDADIELGDHSVAFLRIAITLKSEHYSTLVAARKGGLTPEFQAKVGWLVGNLYSRTATSDWSDQEGGSKDIEALEQLYLDEHIPDLGPVWLDDILIAEAQNNNFEFSKYKNTDLEQQLEKYRPTPSIEILAEEIIGVAKKALKPHVGLLKENCEAFDIAEEKILKIIGEVISSNPECENNNLGIIKNTLKDIMNELKNTTADCLVVNDAKITSFSGRLKNNSRIKKLIK